MTAANAFQVLPKALPGSSAGGESATYVYQTTPAQVTEYGMEVVKQYGLAVSAVPPCPWQLTEGAEIRVFYNVVCWLVVRRRWEPVDLDGVRIYARMLYVWDRLSETCIDDDGTISGDALKDITTVTNLIARAASTLGLTPSVRARWYSRSPRGPEAISGSEEDAWGSLLTAGPHAAIADGPSPN